MRRAAPTAVLAALCCLPTPEALARDLATRHAGDVRASAPRPEYPRPQLRRTSWKSLNGRWQFGFENALDRQILVPFTFEAPLSGIGREREVHERVRYRRTFTVPLAWRNRRVLLHFGAVDHEAVVRVNGVRVGRHTGGYAPFSFDVTSALRPGRRRQTLDVRVRDPARGATSPSASSAPPAGSSTPGRPASGRACGSSRYAQTTSSTSACGPSSTAGG